VCVCVCVCVCADVRVYGASVCECVRVCAWRVCVGVFASVYLDDQLLPCKICCSICHTYVLFNKFQFEILRR